jgi:hypothetical protein
MSYRLQNQVFYLKETPEDFQSYLINQLKMINLSNVILLVTILIVSLQIKQEINNANEVNKEAQMTIKMAQSEIDQMNLLIVDLQKNFTKFRSLINETVEFITNFNPTINDALIEFHLIDTGVGNLSLNLHEYVDGTIREIKDIFDHVIQINNSVSVRYDELSSIYGEVTEGLNRDYCVVNWLFNSIDTSWINAVAYCGSQCFDSPSTYGCSLSSNTTVSMNGQGMYLIKTKVTTSVKSGTFMNNQLNVNWHGIQNIFNLMSVTDPHQIQSFDYSYMQRGYQIFNQASMSVPGSYSIETIFQKI